MNLTFMFHKKYLEAKIGESTKNKTSKNYLQPKIHESAIVLYCVGVVNFVLTRKNL